ncbi:MAG: hypothetical protein AAF791_14305 [Bacteroidota bacterium]
MGLRHPTVLNGGIRSARDIMGRVCVLLAMVGGASLPASASPWGDGGAWHSVTEADSLADRLLSAAMEEAQRSLDAYASVLIAATEKRADAQNRARQRVLTAALAAERGETLLRIRFAMLGETPSDDEGQLRLYLSFLATGADDLLEVDAIDPVALRRHLPELTEPVREILARLAPDE